MWWAVWTGAAGALLAYIIYTRSRRLAGRLVVLTGAHSGVGFETARQLARRGARILLAGNEQSRGSDAADRLARETSADVHYRHLDLSSLRSVRDFASDLIASERRLDVLINNAAVSQLDNSLTEDGIVVEMQINHFGPFLLTNMLLPLLKAAPQGRVVNASSVMHYLGNINVATLAEKARDNHAHKRALASSKLCNILFTRELSRRLEGTSVTANCFHPGEVSREMVEESPYNIIPLVRWLMRLWNREQGPDGSTTAVYLAVSPGLARVSGKYFVDCKETKPSKTALDDSLAEKLWNVSEKLVKLNCA